MDLEWRNRAACRGYDPSMWELNQGPLGVLQQAALRICAVCPVRRECHAFGVQTGSTGMIFGGKSFRTPSGDRRSRVAHLPDPIRCRECNTLVDGSPNGRKAFCSNRCQLAWRAENVRRKRAEQSLLTS